MRRLHLFVILALLGGWLARSEAATFGPARGGAIQRLAASEQSVVLALDTPAYHLTPTSAGAVLSVPGGVPAGQPGSPALVQFSALIGIPADAQPTLHIVSDEFVELAAPVRLAPLPSAALPDSAASPAHVNDSAALPLVQLGAAAWVRDQRVIAVQIAPFQYRSADGHLSWHRHVVVEVRWAAPQITLRIAAPSLLPPAAVINPEQAAQWRSAPAARPAAQPALLPTRYRIVVDHDGLYRISASDLAAAGLDLATTNPQSWQLTNRGQPVAITVSGEQDGRFDAADALLFYGQRLPAGLISDTVVLGGAVVMTDTVMSRTFADPSEYTDDNVYWLTTTGPAGPRMALVDGRPTDTATVPPSFMATMRAEERRFWWTWHFTSRDVWFWDRIQAGGPVTRTYTTTLPGVSPLAASVIVRGEAVARASGGGSPDHHTAVSINGVAVEDATWDGVSRHQFAATLPSSAVHSGVNSLAFTVLPQPALGFDDIYFDWFEVSYPRTFMAVSDQLRWDGASAGRWQYQIGGWTTADPQVFDVTNPAQPRQITNPRITAAGAGYQLAVEVQHTVGAQFLAVASAGWQSAKAITRPAQVDLRAATNGADYVLITPSAFLTATQSLAAYRATQGLRTAVVDIAAVYDQFNDGVFNPIAIKRFLAYAYVNWTAPAPSYVVLVGDGHWNFKNDAPTRYPPSAQWIPPHLAWVDPYQGEVDSTNQLAAIVGADILPDVAIGRLPVNTAAELATMITKIQRYEQQAAQPWQQRLLFVADNTPDLAGDFVASSEDFIAQHLPSGYTADRLYLNDVCGAPSTSPCPAMNAALVSTLNTTGTLIMNYVGHGSLNRWAGEQIFTLADVAQLTNADQLPIVLSLTCLDGFWAYPGQDGLMETMVRANSGAIAAFSPTGLGVATGHDALQRGFYATIFQDGARHLGTAAIGAKLALYATGFNYDLIETFGVLGDPALQVAVPPPPATATPTMTHTASPGPSPTRTATLTATPLIPPRRILLPVVQR